MEPNNNVVQKIQELIAQTKYKEAAELADESIKLIKDLRIERDTAMKERDHASQKIMELTYGVKLTQFSYSTLEEATNNFDDLHKIGEGGYGTVYKGTLPDSHTPVAIKMLKPEKAQGDKEFKHEVEVLSKIRHPNLVSLIGVNAEKKSLIYELIPNGSLQPYLLDDKIPPQALSWETRIHIASGICSALIFLHSQNIVHGDVNPGNILLDFNFTSKLSDFGMSRVLDQTSIYQTQIYKTTVASGKARGATAYIAPEYIAYGELTTGSDVFSFGILLLQLVTGKGPIGLRNLVERAIRRGTLDGIIDGLLVKWPKNRTKKLLLLGLKCSHPEKRERPALEKDVWSIIESMKLAIHNPIFWWKK